MPPIISKIILLKGGFQKGGIKIRSKKSSQRKDYRQNPPHRGIFTCIYFLQWTSRCLQSSDRSTRGHSREGIPAECLSRNEKKATFSFYSILTIYSRWVIGEKELIKQRTSKQL